jgi:hypothetical protein
MGRFNWWSTPLLRWLHERLPMNQPPAPRHRRQPKNRPTLTEHDDFDQTHRLAGDPLPHQS